MKRLFFLVLMLFSTQVLAMAVNDSPIVCVPADKAFDLLDASPVIDKDGKGAYKFSNFTNMGVARITDLDGSRLFEQEYDFHGYKNLYRFEISMMPTTVDGYFPATAQFGRTAPVLANKCAYYIGQRLVFIDYESSLKTSEERLQEIAELSCHGPAVPLTEARHEAKQRPIAFGPVEYYFESKQVFSCR